MSVLDTGAGLVAVDVGAAEAPVEDTTAVVPLRPPPVPVTAKTTSGGLSATDSGVVVLPPLPVPPLLTPLSLGLAAASGSSAEASLPVVTIEP